MSSNRKNDNSKRINNFENLLNAFVPIANSYTAPEAENYKDVRYYRETNLFFTVISNQIFRVPKK